MNITLTSLAALGLFICPLGAQSIVGSWLIRSAGEAQSDAVVTFLANGTYTMAEDGESTLDPSGKDGIERGNYKWNPTTKAFSVKTVVDTTGQWGFSNAKFNTATVTASKLVISDNSGRFTLKRVVGSSKIVGSWFFKNGTRLSVATFLADGSYFMVQDGSSGRDATSGMERGTYTWDPVSKVFTAEALVDTNGTSGFSDGGRAVSDC